MKILYRMFDMNKVIYSAILALSFLIPGSTLAQGQGHTNNVNVFVVVTPTTHQLDLKAIEGESPTRNFYSVSQHPT
jgi:hypothetical protein